MVTPIAHQYAPSTHAGPITIAAPANSPLVTASTIGYRAEIRVWQSRHLPPSTSHPTTGVLWRARIRWPHDGHRDGGLTTEIPAGTRAATTLTKDPTSRPRIDPTRASTDVMS